MAGGVLVVFYLSCTYFFNFGSYKKGKGLAVGRSREVSFLLLSLVGFQRREVEKRRVRPVLGVLVLSTTSICFPHLSCPLLQTHLYISTIVSTPSHILLHETLDATKESPSYSESIHNCTTHTFCLNFFGL